MGADHLDRALRPDEVGRPRQVEPPLQLGTSRRPQAKVPALADDDVCDVLVGDIGEIGKTDQSLPAAPACRLCMFGADDVSNHRVQAVGTDQQIAFGRGAVFELDPHPVARAVNSDRASVESDAFSRKAFQ